MPRLNDLSDFVFKCGDIVNVSDLGDGVVIGQSLSEDNIHYYDIDIGYGQGIRVEEIDVKLKDD